MYIRLRIIITRPETEGEIVPSTESWMQYWGQGHPQNPL